MKIIHLVLGKANPERMNGVNKVAHHLATTQTALGYSVALWGITKNLETNYPPRNYTTRLFQAIGNRFTVHKSLKTAIAEINEPTVFHLHGSFINEFYHLSKLLKKHGIPYVYTAHGSLGTAAMQQNGWVKKIYFALFEKTILKNAKAVHLLGKSEVENVKQLMPALQTIVMLPNGQNLDDIPQIAIDKSQRTAPIFGFLGRLDKNHKGLDLLLKGFAIYREQGGNGTLELVGNGEDRDFLENLAKDLGIAENVTFHGAKFGEEKFAYLANFDVFVHTSRMEGFPTAVLEAAAMSLPCLCSEATNANDYLRNADAGYPYLKNSPENIAVMLAYATSDFFNKNLKQKGKNARKMIETRFTWENVAEELVKVYHS